MAREREVMEVEWELVSAAERAWERAREQVRGQALAPEQERATVREREMVSSAVLLPRQGRAAAAPSCPTEANVYDASTLPAPIAARQRPP
jgi:hypothetical protein